MMRAIVSTAVASVLLAWQSAAQGMPKWVPSDAKDMFGELDDLMASSKAAAFGEEACAVRTKLLKALGPVTGPEKGQIMMMVLQDLGMCELKGNKINAALRRYQSAISELNAPSEDSLMQNTQTAPVVLLKEACNHITKQNPSRAAVELRRTRTIFQRERVKILKNIAKQNNVPANQMDTFVTTIMEKVKSGGQEASQAKPIARFINQFDAQIEYVEKALNNIDNDLVGESDAMKARRKRLTSGSGPFVPAVLMESTLEAENLVVAAELADKASAIAKEVKAAGLEKSVSVIKRSKDGSACETLPKTCEAVKAMPDLSTNGFGETRVLSLKKGKNQAMDLCDTNANLLVLLPLDAGVSLTVDKAKPVELEEKVPFVVDHCLPLNLKASDAASVLAAQVWHPEFATIERTTEVRDRAAKWGLKEDEVKELTKNINAHGKKGWEKVMKTWQAGPAATRLREKLDAALTAEREAKDAAEKNREETERNEDTDRLKAIEELEVKRKQKQEDKERIERERLDRKKKLEAAAAEKEPWLADPDVMEAQKTLADLKEERREANAKLEFDVTKELTKDITKQERLVKKVIKKAKKAHKKGVKTGGAPAKEEKKEKEDASGGDSDGGVAKELAAAESKLEELKKKKQKAADEENFKAAKQLKKEQTELEKEINALRAKSEL